MNVEIILKLFFSRPRNSVFFGLGKDRIAKTFSTDFRIFEFYQFGSYSEQIVDAITKFSDRGMIKETFISISAVNYL